MAIVTEFLGVIVQVIANETQPGHLKRGTDFAEREKVEFLLLILRIGDGDWDCW